MQKLRCILLDDELPALGYLASLCRQIADVELVKTYQNPKKFLQELPTLEFDVCILDIEMPGVDGIEVASHLQNREMAIIFSTAYKEYAAEAFDLEAVDYLRKPYQADRLEKALGRAQAYLAQKRLTSGSMELNSNQGKRVFRFHEIAWITSAPNDRRDKTIWLKDRQEIIVKNISFEQLLALLPEQQFARINRKSIIAMDTVVSYTHEGIRCKFLDESGGPVMIPLSDQYSEDFKQKLQK